MRARMWRRSSERESRLTISTTMPLAEALTDYSPRANRVLSEVISSGLEEHHVTVGSSHFDTTSLSVYGEYGNQDCENAIEVVLGYSKDRRPDLKQIQFGIGVTREGVLNYGEVLSGNSSDKTWNRKTLGKVKTMFPPEILKDLIYVADSSLVTDENLKEAGNQVKFISRMPATYGLVAETIKKAWDLDLWEPAGSYASRKEAAEYWVYETVHRTGEIDYRLIAVRSSSLDSRKEKSIMKRVEKARERESCFVLITNLMDADMYPSSSVLGEYKQQ